MKPTSIIFIIVSIVIIICGNNLCKRAEKLAIEEGIEIFNQTYDEGNAIQTVIFGKDEIYNKLELVIDEADVYIYGGTAEPYMELYNFDEGTYALTTSNRSISLNTSIDIMSIIKFWETGFSFNGIRNYISRDGVKEVVVSKKVNVYLPTDGDLNVVNIDIDRGNVYISNLDTSIDLSVSVGEGNAVFNSVATDSHIKGEIGKGSLYLSDVTAGTLTAAIDDGDINAERFDFTNVSVTGKKTNISITTSQSFDFFDMFLSARNGDISINGENLGTQYNFDSSSQKEATIMITVTEGDVMLEQVTVTEIPDEGGNAEDSGANSGADNGADNGGV